MMLILIVFVVWIGLYFLLAAGTIFLQGYLEESPPPVKEVLWRAAAGAGVVALFFGIWVWLASGNPDRWAALTDFSATHHADYVPTMKYVVGKVTTDVRLRKGERGREEYRTAQNAPMPSRPDKILIVEDGQEVTFVPDRDAEGKFKPEPGRGLIYRDEKGRIMQEGSLGQLTTRRGGWLITYFLMTLLHGAVWLAAAWPIMRFSLGQSILIAVVAWVVGTLFVLPPLIGQARKVHETRTRIQEKKESGRGGENNRREGLTTLPHISGVRRGTPARSAGDRAKVGRAIGAGHYLAATEAAGISILTVTSWPALTVTRSSLTWPFISAFSV